MYFVTLSVYGQSRGHVTVCGFRIWIMVLCFFSAIQGPLVGRDFLCQQRHGLGSIKRLLMAVGIWIVVIGVQVRSIAPIVMAP